MTTEEIQKQIEEIRARIDAERARRPNGYATRCERCRFWEASAWRKNDRPDDDQDGECHRYAPQIPHRHTVKAIGRILWAVEESANVGHDDFDYLYECREAPYHDWPTTIAEDWCGEFQERAT